MEQNEERGQRCLGVLFSETDDRHPRPVRIVVNLANDLLLPIPQPDLFADVPAFGNPTMVLDPADIALAAGLSFPTACALGSAACCRGGLLLIVVQFASSLRARQSPGSRVPAFSAGGHSPRLP